jgi:hypothetical protein
MKLLRVGFLFLSICVLWAIASQATFCADEDKWSGYLVDRQCADSIKGSSATESFVRAHTKDCAVMCQDKGYSLYSQGRWLSLDARGNSLALKHMKASQRVRGFYVQVTGKIKDSTISVWRIEEIPEPKDGRRNGVNSNGSR